MELLKKIFSHKMLFMLIHGISAGTPLLLIGGTLQALLVDSKIDLGTVGMLALARTPYSFKPLWSPLLDRYSLGFLQRRKGWIFVFQICLAITIGSLGMIDPVKMPWMLGLMALFAGFFASSQDIVIDAYRREVLKDEELGFGSSVYIMGYRIGMLFAGAMALKLSDVIGWEQVYLIMGGIMFLCSFSTFFAPVEDTKIQVPKSLRESIIGPFKEFFSRDGALLMLAFILFYKIGDQMASNMTMPFYLNLGYTKGEIGTIAKVWGMGATIAGGFLGGGIMLKIGIKHSLWLFGFLQMFSTFGFSLLSLIPKNALGLTGVIAFENLSAGMGTAAYVAYMASITNKKFTATQYGLLTSLMSLPMTILAAPTGFMAQSMGWFNFFTFCTLIAIPGMFLLYRMNKWVRPQEIE
ncbi:AmpG family muropeptide MFS transporter [Bacteriovoracaceae bacterium]|nr:AmpG family muropeptide MFS transporter [Bacteriovoracaceae bacterium]